MKIEIAPTDWRHLLELAAGAAMRWEVEARRMRDLEFVRRMVHLGPHERRNCVDCGVERKSPPEDMGEPTRKVPVVGEGPHIQIGNNVQHITTKDSAGRAGPVRLVRRDICASCGVERSVHTAKCAEFVELGDKLIHTCTTHPMVRCLRCLQDRPEEK